MKCAICFYGGPKFQSKEAEFIIDGTSVCEDHVDAITGSGFGIDLYNYQKENE